ncbi:glutathione S-transferase [Shewanella algae]|uniref:glutathione S-transferase n=1 Tax=Shewanella algae TaxID=38313 RepID=UPI001FB7BA4A|nr:glutathione S-transferase [Shewanella algae]
MTQVSSQTVLYSFRRCPYAMRARLGLIAADQSVVVREILLKNKPQEMLALSPKGTVPVMQLADGRVLDESLDILFWALAQADPHSLLPQNPEEENLTSALIATNDRAFKPLLDRYKYFDRYPEFSQQSYFEQALEYLLPLEQRLAEAQGLQEQVMLLGRMSAADLAIFPFVRQFAHVDRARFNAAPLPCLTQWLQAWLEHPWFIRAMKPKPLWLESAEQQPL